MIDLRSDTVTRPSQAMREAIASAEVGDDVWGDDPSAAAFERLSPSVPGLPPACSSHRAHKAT
ncbi:hypothetical protein GCM10007159_13710 [Modicisalibacter luteus]|nr:beta-eliminating lyase-related protein [Halomonas lutea]GHA93349.1 hypothetical protein GCM10007159_13710 [Halomonas lutea]